MLAWAKSFGLSQSTGTGPEPNLTIATLLIVNAFQNLEWAEFGWRMCIIRLLEQNKWSMTTREEVVRDMDRWGSRCRCWCLEDSIQTAYGRWRCIHSKCHIGSSSPIRRDTEHKYDKDQLAWARLELNFWLSQIGRRTERYLVYCLSATPMHQLKLWWLTLKYIIKGETSHTSSNRTQWKNYQRTAQHWWWHLHNWEHIVETQCDVLSPKGTLNGVSVFELGTCKLLV